MPQNSLGWELSRLSRTVCVPVKLTFLFNYLISSMISTGVVFLVLRFLQSTHQAHSDCDVPPAAGAGREARAVPGEAHPLPGGAEAGPAAPAGTGEAAAGAWERDC